MGYAIDTEGGDPIYVTGNSGNNNNNPNQSIGGTAYSPGNNIIAFTNQGYKGPSLVESIPIAANVLGKQINTSNPTGTNPEGGSIAPVHVTSSEVDTMTGYATALGFSVEAVGLAATGKGVTDLIKGDYRSLANDYLGDNIFNSLLPNGNSTGGSGGIISKPSKIATAINELLDDPANYGALIILAGAAAAVSYMVYKKFIKKGRK